MARITTKGVCARCGATLGKRAMANHLKKCLATSEDKTPSSAAQAEVFDLLVQGEGMPFFWLYVTADSGARLQDLDQFLRDIWLECCGHMSVFRIGSTDYFITAAGELGGRSMKATLDSVLAPGLEFTHEYDFGDTTYLRLKVLDKRLSKPNKNKVRLLARNEMPPIKCDSCSQPATQLCQICVQEWADEARFCNECAPRHKCGEDYLLPFTNSPRCGQCGYTGD